MEKIANNIRDVLACKRSTLLVSSKTQKPFMGSEREAYLFFDETLAKECAKAVDDTTLDEFSFKADYKQFMNYLFDLGFLSVVIDNSDESALNTNCSNTRIRFGNKRAAAGVLLTIESSSGDYVPLLAEGMFIIPAKADGSKVVYAAARNNSGEKYFLAFTSEREYETWSQKSENKIFVPLLIKAKTLVSVSKDSDIIVNIMGCRMLINNAFKALMFPTKANPAPVKLSSSGD